MSDPDRQIDCAKHGQTMAAYLCRHLQTGYGCGFHDAGTPDEPWPDAWCDQCQAIVDRDGEWTDENQGAADIRVVCTGCYAEARENNRRVPAPLAPGELMVTEERFFDLVHAAHEHAQRMQETARSRFRFDDKGHWQYDPDDHVILFYDDGDDGELVADVDLVGSFSTRTNTWMWAWGNEQYAPELRARSTAVQVFGEVRGIRKLAEAHWPADELDGWEVAQIAAHLLGAEALYRAPFDHLHVFMLLRNFRHRLRRATMNGIEK